MRFVLIAIILSVVSSTAVGLTPPQAEARKHRNRNRSEFPPVVYYYSQPSAHTSSYLAASYALPQTYSSDASYPSAMYASQPYGRSHHSGSYASQPYSSAMYTSQPYSQPYAASSYPSQPHDQAQPALTVSAGLYDNYFRPFSINIAAGTTVEWKNYGHHDHTVTSTNYLWDSGRMRPSETYRYTFSQPGTYYFFCALHPQQMRGVVDVR